MFQDARTLWFAGGIALGWVLLEAVARIAAVAVAVVALAAPLLGVAVGLALFPAVAAVLTVVALRSGQEPTDWGWRLTGWALLVGVAGGVARIALLAATTPIDAALFGDGGGGDLVAALAPASPTVLALFFLGNAVLVPIAEEQVWRGVIQTAFVDRLGPVTGVLVTAVLFGAKHALIDASLGRLVTNVTGGVLYGAIAHRFGTAASTATHLTGNAIATGIVVALAL